MEFHHKLARWSRRYVFLPGVAHVLLTALLLVILLHTLGRPAVAYAAGGAVLVVGLLLVSGFARSSRKQGQALVHDLGEVVGAGDWAMKHALGRSPLGDLDETDSELLGMNKNGIADVVWPLEDWLRSVRTAGRGEHTALTSGEVERDLELAKEFQQAYLNRPYPRIPEVHVAGRLRLNFYHRYEPALALGGDFYDILRLASDCAGVFIADVMGHGSRSALITSMLRTLLGDLQHHGRNAPHFLTEVNKQFCAMLRSLPNPLFASAYYFVADTTGRVATYSSAGHPAPFMVRSHLKRVTRLEVPAPRGAALGLIPDESFTGGHVRLMDGDVFLFFTDGVYEAHNQLGEEFGVARIEELLRKMVYRSAREMVDGVMTAVKEFAGEQPIMDDICMVAVEVTDKAAAKDTHA